MPKSSILKSARAPAAAAPPPRSRTTWPPSTIWPASGKPVIGARLAKHMAHLGAGGHRVDPAHGPGRLRQGRAGQGADPDPQGPADRRGHGPPAPAAGALADRQARAELDRRPRGGASPRARASRRAWRIGWPRCSACRPRVPTATPSPAWRKTVKVSSRFRWPRPARAPTVVVERITEEAEADKDLLEYLWRQNVRPGRRVKITEVAPWAGTITASGDGQSIDARLAGGRRRSGCTCRTTRRNRQPGRATR